MELKKIKIKRIIETDSYETVYDLAVEKNNNFFIGNEKVLTHNCDFLTPNAQAALRNIIETTSKQTRFVSTCNYLERLIEPIRSRLMEFHIVPPDKLSVAKRCKEILDLENVNFDPKDVIALIEQGYPDIRKIIGTLQRNSLNGSLKIENQERLISDYCSKILEELKQGSNPKQTYQNIRQIIAESKVRQFDDLFRLLFDKLEEWVPDGKRSSIILVLAEFQQRTWLVQVDKEIQIAAMFVNILKELQ